VNQKRIAERTVKELSEAREQWEVQRKSLWREYEAQSCAAEERANEVLALVAEVQALKEQIKQLSMDLGVVEPDSKGSSEVFRENGIKEGDLVSTAPDVQGTPPKSDTTTDADPHPIFPSIAPENAGAHEAQCTLPTRDTAHASPKTLDTVDGALATSSLSYVYPSHHMQNSSRASGIRVGGGVPHRQL